MADRALDSLEAVTNAVVGLTVSVLAVWAVFPLFGWVVTAPKSLAVSGLFFGLSALRSFVLRRLFRRLGHG